jgi:hypothetical protein
MAAIGMIPQAERIVHRGEPYLLVRLTVQNVRTTRRADGRYDSVRVGEGAAAYLPVRIHCDAATLDAGGARQQAHALSPCDAPLVVPAPFATPVFMVFRYPRSGTAKVGIPVTVLPPSAAVATRRDTPAPPALPAAQQALLGERVFTLVVAVPERR